MLLDTHVVVRWLAEPKKLSREQLWALRGAVSHRETLALSATTLLEIAILFREGSTRLRLPARTIVATARVHRLRLVTSDERIMASKLVPVVA